MNTSAHFFFAALVTAGFFYCIHHMFTIGFPPENKDALNSLLGVLTTIFTLQMNFYFGSSSASKAKDETISEIAKAAPPAPVPAPPAPPAPPSPPINIPNANTVTVETKDGNVNINPKEDNI